MIRRAEAFLLLLACLAIGWFYLWTVRSNGDPWKFGQEQRDYYNLLIDGWLDGQLHMKVDVPDALLRVKNPYDYRQRPPGVGLHDTSFYRGRYYLYFGAGPVVTLMLPFRLVTGTDLPMAVAVLLFAYGAFVASTATWLAIRRRYFPETGALATTLAVLVLGMAGLEPVLLRRPQIWELPIAAGSFFALLSLFFVFRALHGTRPKAWLAAAGLGIGLAVACRPTYLVAVPLLAAPLVVFWREQHRLPWRLALAALLPVAAIGALIAWHNWARFGNPFESGQTYQFNFDYDVRHVFFSAAYIPTNVWRYFFAPAAWSPYFPFIGPIIPAGMKTYGGHEDLYGILVHLPVAWAAILSPLALWQRGLEERRRLAAWLAAAGFMFAAVAGLLLCFFGVTVRYLSDFTPALILLACVGLLAAERWARLALPAAGRAVWRIAWVSAALFSLGFVVIYSLQVNGLLRERNPRKEAEIARRMNRVPAFFQSLFRVRHGAWSMELSLPPGRVGQAETLLTLGDPPRVDRVWVRYLENSQVQFGISRPASPELVSRPLALDRARAHRLRLAIGALLPPGNHPLFADSSSEDVRRATGLLRLDVDGETMIQAHRRFEPIGANRVRIGREAIIAAAWPAFSGEIISHQRTAMNADELAPLGAEFFRMRLVWPTDATGRREPLVSLGEANGRMLVFAEFPRADRVRFGAWVSGVDVGVSEPVAFEPGRIGDLVIVVQPSRSAGRAAVQVRLDETIVWSAQNIPAPTRAGRRELGQNLVGDPAAVPTLTARVYSSDLVANGRDPLRGAGEVVSLSVLLPRNRVGTREPLVVTGRTGEGDILGVEYLAGDRIRFFLDHWGSPLLESEPLRVDFGSVQELTVRMESLASPPAGEKPPPEQPGSLQVRLGRRVVWEQSAKFYAADPEEIGIGRNPIGGSHAAARFSGDIVLASRGAR